MKENLKNNKAITLISLVVTIIVLIILAGISINLLLGQNGIIEKAKQGKENYILAANEEKAEMANTEVMINETMREISKEESYVGYYADIEGDGIVDGIIYADLAIGGSGIAFKLEAAASSPSYNVAYTIPKETNIKEYYVSKTGYVGTYGNEARDVITPKKGTTGKDRFYIMALKDLDGNVNTTQYCWYGGGYGMNDYAETTSVDFGKGETNTINMIEKWNAKAYGEQDDRGNPKDVWGQIKEERKKGWFIPSRLEWAAFTDNLSVNTNNYQNLNLSTPYWSSSQASTGQAWYADYKVFTTSGNYSVQNICYVRLSAKF